MKKRLLLLLTAIEASIVLAAIYFEPTFCVRGLLWGEAFYYGKPTSYWRDELQRWEVRREFGHSWLGHRETFYYRNQSSFEQFRERWFGQRGIDLAEWLALSLERRNGPAILHDPAAIPVLRELLDDPSPKIRLFAEIGLGMNPTIPED